MQQLDKQDEAHAAFVTIHSREEFFRRPGARDALQKELQNHEKHGTWEVVPRPTDPQARRKIIPCKTVYAEKDDGRLKVRVVARGDRVKDEIQDTYAPVASLPNVRLMLLLSASWPRRSVVDVEAAYLNAALPEHEQVLMEAPEGLDIDRSRQVLRLKRALYGLKQSGRRWHDTVAALLDDLGFSSVLQLSDRTFYVKRDENGHPASLLVLYVDDMMLASRDSKLHDSVLQALGGQLTLTVKELPATFLSIDIVPQEDGSFKLSQPRLVDKVLEDLRMTDCAPSRSPMVAGVTIGERASGEPACPINMARTVGMLQYLVQGTRPDLAYVVNQLSRHQKDASLAHFQVVKRICRYLQGTRHLGITVRPDSANEAVVYTDSDFNLVGDHKSTGGYVVFIGGTPVFWRSYKQRLIALSSTEAETVTASDAAREAIHYRHLLEALGFPVSTCPLVRGDNQSMIAASEGTGSSTSTSRLRHLHHLDAFIAECVRSGDVRIEYVPSQDNVADIFTKALPPDQFIKLRGLLGMQ